MRRVAASMLIVLIAFGMYSNSIMGKLGDPMLMPEKLDLEKILVAEESKKKKQ